MGAAAQRPWARRHPAPHGALTRPRAHGHCARPQARCPHAQRSRPRARCPHAHGALTPTGTVPRPWARHPAPHSMRQMLAHTAAGKSGRASDTPLHRRRHSCIMHLATIVRATVCVQRLCACVQHATCQLSIMLVFVELFWRRVGDAVPVAVTALHGLRAPVHGRYNFARYMCVSCPCLPVPSRVVHGPLDVVVLNFPAAGLAAQWKYSTHKHYS